MKPKTLTNFVPRLKGEENLVKTHKSKQIVIKLYRVEWKDGCGEG